MGARLRSSYYVVLLWVRKERGECEAAWIVEQIGLSDFWISVTIGGSPPFHFIRTNERTQLNGV